ncbi:coiled-coil domain-containing protein 30 isoform X3 [Channa argus]
MSAWFSEEGLAQDSPKEAQLCVLWRAHQATRSRLICVTRDLDIQRSQHLAEMAEVRKSLEQIRVFTDQKDVLAQKIQDENDLLKDRLQGLLSIQDAQTSEVAKMLYQQGLTELIPSSPSEQVAYLLVERASLLEIIETPDKLTADRNTNSPLGTGTEMPNIYTQQSAHKGAPRHSQSPWKRLFGLHKVSQSKHIPVCSYMVEVRCLTGQSSIVERERSRLERDLEEGSRRLAMAHSEIRRLTDELESAHLTQRTYEPELQAAQQEVEQLGQEVEKLKKYEMVELRKAKELNDRLDLEIRALRSRVRTLDSEKKSLQQMVVCLQEEVEQLNSELQQLQAVHGQAAELAQSNTNCRMFKEKLSTETRCFSEKEEKECPECQEAVRTLFSTQDECETLKKEICETLKCLDKERSKNHEMKEKHKAKLCRSKLKFNNETTWRDDKIKSLERELSLCSHSLSKLSLQFCLFHTDKCQDISVGLILDVLWWNLDLIIYIFVSRRKISLQVLVWKMRNYLLRRGSCYNS